jgi:hypothetical protein
MQRKGQNQTGQIKSRHFRDCALSELQWKILARFVKKPLNVISGFNFLDDDLLRHGRIARIHGEVSLLFTTSFIL